MKRILAAGDDENVLARPCAALEADWRRQPPQVAGLTIRRQLVRLVAAAVLPAVLASSLLIAYAHDRQSALVESRTLDIARALAQSVDRELARYQAGSMVLATSPHFEAGDLAGFHRQARQAIRDLQGDIFVLSDASGQQLVNTDWPFGETLPQRTGLSQVRRVFETGKPAISDLFEVLAARRPVIAIDVPVRLDDRVAYALALAVFPERLGEVLKYQKIAPDWVVSIFDRQGRIVARSHNPEQFIGKKGAPLLVERMAQDAEGRVETDTLEGIPVVAVFSRSEMSQWSVAIGVPRSSIAGDLWLPIGWLIAGTVLMFAAAIMMAQRLGSRISGSFDGLIPPSVALGRGDPVVVPPLHLREADEVGRELVHASERLHDRERTLALVSHDLRTPLNAFTMRAATIERLAQRLPGGEPIRNVAAALVVAARQMSGTVDDLLSISVATSGGRSMLKMASISSASLLERVSDAARPHFADRGIELETEKAGALPDIRIDTDRVLRVFANLIDNALKFTERPGSVVLRAKAESDGVRFCVANSGPALSAAMLADMFKPFWQAGQADLRGAGLGLSICRSIVEAHGGTICAEPEPGMQVRISFTLPLASVSSPA